MRVVSLSVGDNQNDVVRILIAVVAAAIIVVAVVVSKRRGNVMSDDAPVPTATTV